MKPWLFLLPFSLAISGFPAPVPAQFLDSHLQAQRHDNLRRHQQRIAKQRAQAGRPRTAHQRACAKRYNSYNPQTDNYTARPGVERRCRL